MTTPLQQAPIVSASIMLANRGIYGLVWLSANYEVAAIYGSLVSGVEVGAPITDSFPLLEGYEIELDAVARGEQQALTLPSVCVVTAEGPGPRINISVFKGQSPAHTLAPIDSSSAQDPVDRDTSSSFLMLITKVMSQSTTEMELSRQMRARLMAEEAVAQKSRELTLANSELQLANRDLEDYAAVISHDLKSPLRALRYLADDVESAIATGDAEKAHSDLQRLRTQSRRMSDMLSALLDYASVGRKADVLEETNTRQLIKTITASIPYPAKFKVEITGTWPSFETLKAPLDLVLRNLIDNAIKHHDRADGRVVVNAEPSNSDLVITVSDDGPGIDEQHHATIFLPFRTLETSPAAGSSGMGLALAKRTVETAGGSLALCKQGPGARGARFQINWPLKMKSEH